MQNRTCRQNRALQCPIWVNRSYLVCSRGAPEEKCYGSEKERGVTITASGCRQPSNCFSRITPQREQFGMYPSRVKKRGQGARQNLHRYRSWGYEGASPHPAPQLSSGILASSGRLHQSVSTYHQCHRYLTAILFLTRGVNVHLLDRFLTVESVLLQPRTSPH